MSAFAAPRLFAAAAAVCALLALVVWPLVGYGWHEIAGAMVLAVVFGWVSCDTCALARERRRREHDHFKHAVESWDGRDPDPNERSLAA